MRTLYVIDEITGKRIRFDSAMIVVTSVDDDHRVSFGYTAEEYMVSKLWINHYGTFDCIPDKIRDKIKFSKRYGLYKLKSDLQELCRTDLLYDENILYAAGNGNFPYSFNRYYEAINHMDRFVGHQTILNPKEYQLAKYMKYSFGIEFETSGGIIPQEICFRDGLIPLRDGSIGGLEYSTIVLSGNEGLSLLQQQLQTLREYTAFDKECSLHMHFGGFTINRVTIYNLYRVCQSLEYTISRLVPEYTFESSRYKASGKDYCNKLPSFNNFDELYCGLVGKTFFGSFTQPHPNDITRTAKWKIPTRYYWVNFINALCYDVNKTIEFRLLRPTYNLEKILTWMYIFNALLVYSDCNTVRCRTESLTQIIKKVYPVEVSEVLLEELDKLRCVTEMQYHAGDMIGSNLEMENKLFNLDGIV